MALGRNTRLAMLGSVAAGCLALFVAWANPAAAETANKFDAAEVRVEALAKAGKIDAAIIQSRKLIAVARRVLKKDPKLAVFITELAALQAGRGDLAEAEKLQREANAITSEIAGADAPAMIGGLKALAGILAKGQGAKLDEAESTLARAEAIAESAFGPGSPEVGDVQAQRAEVLALLGRKAEADALLSRAKVAILHMEAEAGGPVIPKTEFQIIERDEAEKRRQAATAADKAAGETAGASQDNLPETTKAAPSQPPGAAPPSMPEAAAPESPEVGAASPQPGKPKPKTSMKKHAVPSAAPPPPAAGSGGTVAASPQAVEHAEAYHIVDVFYGTNRQLADGTPRISFTASEADALTLGAVRVSVPANHQVPEVERPWSLRVPFTAIEVSFATEDPNKHFTIQSINTLPEAAFLANVKDRLAQSQTYKGQALVFVHGFYNTFDDALYRTAQITYDMQFDGAAFMFSWPSAGTLDAYRTDSGKAERAGVQLRNFLELVARKSGATRVTVIAHSMGNLPLMEALDETAATGQPALDTLIDDVVLAAPDIGRKEFATMAEHIRNIRGGVTLYAASNDLALAASRSLNGEGRAGDTRPDGPLLLPHVDTIDATSTSLQMFRLNHFYVAESSAVLCDLERLLRTGLHPPDARTRLLTPVADGSGKYYAFR